jgi:hypothetical protein
MPIFVLRKSEVSDLITEGLLFLMFPGASIMRFDSSALMLDFLAYLRNSSIANKLDPAAPSKGLENVD